MTTSARSMAGFRGAVERAARMVCGKDEKEGEVASLYSACRLISSGSVGKHQRGWPRGHARRDASLRIMGNPRGRETIIAA
jgi:hypothetical protein